MRVIHASPSPIRTDVVLAAAIVRVQTIRVAEENLAYRLGVQLLLVVERAFDIPAAESACVSCVFGLTSGWSGRAE